MIPRPSPSRRPASSASVPPPAGRAFAACLVLAFLLAGAGAARAASSMHNLTWSEQADSVLFRMDFTEPLRSPKVHDSIRDKRYFHVDFHGATGPREPAEWDLDKSFVRHVKRLYYPESNVLRLIFYTRDGSPVRLDLSGLGRGYSLTARLLPQAAAPSVRKGGGGRKLVVIDPGHGGDSMGAATTRPVNGRTLYEKDLVMEIAKRMVPLFERTDNLDFVMTRTGDRTVSLDERIAFADKVRGDFFVSIHMNATDSREKTASGFEVYYLSDGSRMTDRKLEALENDHSLDLNSRVSGGGDLKGILSSLAGDKFRERRKESVLASMVFDQTFRREGPFRGNSRGVKTAGFRVLMNYNMPSILVECGFIDNPSEAARLARPEVQDQIAVLMFNAINQYFARSDPDFQANVASYGGVGPVSATAGR